MDQLLENGNKQDGFAVLSFLEAVLRKFSVELPHIGPITAFSDNAACYHNKELVLGIPIINATSTKAKIVRMMHTETQDGKGDCDRHGAIGNRKIDKDWLRDRDEPTENKLVVTPKQLGRALACKDGLQNNGMNSFRVASHLIRFF